MLNTRYRNFSSLKSHLLNELTTRQIYRKMVHAGEVVIDLGANEGFHSRELAKIVGLGGLVHCFEPNPAMWENLLNIPNTRLWPFAIGDAISVETFFLPTRGDYHQLGSIVDPRDFMGQIDIRTISVPQVNLDALDEIRSRNVVFIKVDIERREANFFVGAAASLKQGKPIIVFENNNNATQNALLDVQFTVIPMIDESIGIDMPNSIAIHDSRLADKSVIQLSCEELSAVMDEADT